MKDMKEDHGPHPHLAPLLAQYARDLAQITPSADLDARIGTLVAGWDQKSAKESTKGSAKASARDPAARQRLPHGPWAYAAAAGLAVLAIGVGIFIGMRLEHSRKLAAANAAATHDAVWPPADLTMWPTDSVSFKVPAEYSPQGNLVAVDPHSKNTTARYWIDVVVSNDGTFRIERIVPADSTHKQGGHDNAAPQVQ
jgi:hypothetical protein